MCRFFCKITNLKKLLDRIFHIGRIDLYTVHKNVASNLQQIRDTAKKFSTEDWKVFLLRSIGIEPATLSERARNAVLLRMVPFVERNYNLVELGPRGTGKSHLFQQVSPYAHLISGGKATVARMFVNNSTGQRGLVCQYDVVCFDEISGITFDQKDGVNIMKVGVTQLGLSISFLTLSLLH